MPFLSVTLNRMAFGVLLIMKFQEVYGEIGRRNRCLAGLPTICCLKVGCRN